MTSIIQIARPRRPQMQIEGTIALVTGANRGIGKAFADALLERGAAKVYAGVRDVATVSDADPRLVPVQLDVTDADQVAAVAHERGDVQLVVNNAGIGHQGTPLSATLDTARVELEVNYLGLIATTQAFAPVLAANGGGAFVNVLSVVSWLSSPILSTYSASKSAAWSFTNSARVELKRQGTHVVGVHVGFVDTDLTAGFDVEKIAPAAVAAAALDAVEAGDPEAVVDDLSRQVKAGLGDDQRTLYPHVELDFAALVGSAT
jgi:NAD(P)-dependent dehydrogenase (short-subunit alcohol dehydrogenase family)